MKQAIGLQISSRLPGDGGLLGEEGPLRRMGWGALWRRGAYLTGERVRASRVNKSAL